MENKDEAEENVAGGEEQYEYLNMLTKIVIFYSNNSVSIIWKYLNYAILNLQIHI